MTRKQGRPSKYNAEIHDNLVYQLVRDNKTNDDIAENYLKITRSTFYEWLNSHKSFSDNYKKGVEAKLDKVEANIYQRAGGMTYKEITKTVVKDKNGKEIGKVEVKETTKYLPPDVAAMCFILKTQRRDKWAERQEVDINEGSLTINVAPATKQNSKCGNE